jgi:pimeloyl-ACP methyl ester carboxylesterase
MGTLAVIICLAIPVALGTITWQIDTRNAAEYLQSAEATVTAVASDGPALNAPRSGTGMLANHYYFLSGCVSNPGDCGKAHGGSWGEYYLTLRAIYDEVATEARDAGGAAWPAFETWATDHTHFINTRTTTEGSPALDESLAEILTGGKIHLLGTSVGGSVALAYLSRAMRGQTKLDPKLASAAIVDAPLGFQFPMQAIDIGPGIQAGFLKSDVQSRIGEWLRIRGIPVLTVDTQYDIIGHDPVPGVSYDPNPRYGDDQPARPVLDPDCQVPMCQTANFFESVTIRNAWHEYTGSHIPGSVAEFMREHWR